jgi:hypothetical protein
MIEHLITTILLTAGILIYWFDVVKLHLIFWVKPFNCQCCLAFWVGIFSYLIPIEYQLPIIGATYSIFLYIFLKEIYNGNTIKRK